MGFKTPSFWYQDTGQIWAQILRPVSWLYALGHIIHQKSKTPHKVDVPVLCVGNLVAGGSGKTPSALALLKIIKDHDIAKKSFFLTRGYGGDEDQILSQHAPTIINADRVAGAKEAHDKGADLIIMDDGFQNPSLHKDCSLIVIDGAMGFGNGLMIPAGPLRGPLKCGLKKTDGVVFIDTDKRETKSKLPNDLTIFDARFAVEQSPDPNKRYIAFAGLGYPKKFFTFLQDTLRLNVVDQIAFPDHHPYSASDIEALQKKAKDKGAELITTEKDAIKIPEEALKEIAVPKVHILWSNEDALATFLKTKLKTA